MNQDAATNIITMLSQIEEDDSVPKSIRNKIKLTKDLFADSNVKEEIKYDKSIQELDDIAKDPAVPTYIRPQIWNILSILEGSK